MRQLNPGRMAWQSYAEPALTAARNGDVVRQRRHSAVIELLVEAKCLDMRRDYFAGYWPCGRPSGRNDFVLFQNRSPQLRLLDISRKRQDISRKRRCSRLAYQRTCWRFNPYEGNPK
jgi:hypothetical protein